ncbi:helix-turn-helix domain-containing protein [Lysinibacillus capsici]|uniref:helix-turn-helix domain-containing protein n=1 Tax=Lysinibacillus capsici TaxID=2115968 RepID=UPI003BAAFB7D
MNDITTNFSRNIKDLRIKNKLTQKQLAEMLSKKESTVRMWELNKNEPSLTTLVKLSKIFNVSIDEMIGVNE